MFSIKLGGASAELRSSTMDIVGLSFQVLAPAFLLQLPLRYVLDRLSYLVLAVLIGYVAVISLFTPINQSAWTISMLTICAWIFVVSSHSDYSKGKFLFASAFLATSAIAPGLIPVFKVLFTQNTYGLYSVYLFSDIYPVRSSGLGRALFILSCIILLFAARLEGNRKYIGIITSLCLFVFALLFNSRGVVMSACIAFACAATVILISKKTFSIRNFGLICFSLVAAFAVLIIFLERFSVDRLLDASGRFHIWIQLIEIRQAEGIWNGSGWRGDRVVLEQRASNAFIFALYNGGIFGLGAFCLFLSISVYCFLKCLSAENNDWIRFFEACIVFFLIARCLIEPSLALPGIDLALFYWLVLNRLRTRRSQCNQLSGSTVAL